MKREKKNKRAVLCVIYCTWLHTSWSCSNIQHLIFFKGAYTALETAEPIHGQTVGRILVSEDSLSFIL